MPARDNKKKFLYSDTDKTTPTIQMQLSAMETSRKAHFGDKINHLQESINHNTAKIHKIDATVKDVVEKTTENEKNIRALTQSHCETLSF